MIFSLHHAMPPDGALMTDSTLANVQIAPSFPRTYTPIENQASLLFATGRPALKQRVWRK